WWLKGCTDSAGVTKGGQIRRVVRVCIALIAEFAVSSPLAQSYPHDAHYGGGSYGAAPAPSHSDDYGTPDSSPDSYGSSESAPVDIAPPAEAPPEHGAGEDHPPED